jgi:AcrR family transcriptional regulator
MGTAVCTLRNFAQDEHIPRAYARRVAGTAAGLRERKKAATRQALHEAAVRLAARDGYDHVTVEAIADAATVSRRTFSNYFSSKEEAFVHGDLVRVRHLLDLVHDRPEREPPWTALVRAVERFTAESDGLDRRELAARRELRRHPSLLPYQLAVYAAVERDLAAEVARRMPAGPDAPLRSRLVAATFLTAMRVATQQSLDEPDQAVADLVRRAVGYVAR